MLNKDELNKRLTALALEDNPLEQCQLDVQEHYLATWKNLLLDIAKKGTHNPNDIDIPSSFDIQNLFVNTDATRNKFHEVEKVIKKVLQHPDCPPLTFNIELNNRYKGIRPPFAIIFEPLTSGQCIARGLTINLIGEEAGEEAHVLPEEMAVLVKGLTEGKCPENLTINFKTLYIATKPGEANKTNAWALKKALEHPNCPSGLVLTHKDDNDLGQSERGPESQKLYKEFMELCKDGKYDRKNICKKIDDIQVAINKELETEINRLGEKDSTRSEILETLKTDIRNICQQKKGFYDKYCDRSETHTWKTDLKGELEKKINDALNDKSINKKHTDFEKYGKYLLNVITGLIFPLAIIKYATTGSLFYSTVGKSHEAVEKVLTMAQDIKPKP